MKQIDVNKLDYLILACIVNSEETEKDIVYMVHRFMAMRFQCEMSFPFNIQNPPSETRRRQSKD